jgi:hypothetical protein
MGIKVSEYVRIEYHKCQSTFEIRRELAELALNRKLFHHMKSRAMGNGE